MLVVEDDRALARKLAAGLTDHGFDVALASGAAEARSLLQEPPAAIVLDWGLPDVEGPSFCRELRRKCDAPILFLTGRSDVNDKIAAFDSGANDFVVKPVDVRELAARIVAHTGLRRERHDELVCGAISIRFPTQVVQVKSRPLEEELTAVELRLLIYLMQHEGRSIPKRELEAALFDVRCERPSNFVAVHVSRLRRKLGVARNQLVTDGAGYQLVAEP